MQRWVTYVFNSKHKYNNINISAYYNIYKLFFDVIIDNSKITKKIT